MVSISPPELSGLGTIVREASDEVAHGMTFHVDETRGTRRDPASGAISIQLHSGDVRYILDVAPSFPQQYTAASFPFSVITVKSMSSLREKGISTVPADSRRGTTDARRPWSFAQPLPFANPLLVWEFARPFL